MSIMQCIDSLGNTGVPQFHLQQLYGGMQHGSYRTICHKLPGVFDPGDDKITSFMATAMKALFRNWLATWKICEALAGKK